MTKILNANQLNKMQSSRGKIDLDSPNKREDMEKDVLNFFSRKTQCCAVNKRPSASLLLDHTTTKANFLIPTDPNLLVSLTTTLSGAWHAFQLL